MLLTTEFLSQYPDQPDHMNELGSFVFYRTYARWLPGETRRETWKEAVTRAVEYNCGMELRQQRKNGFPADTEAFTRVQTEAETLFDNIFNLRQFLSGRTHWVGGAPSGVAEKFPLANFNCSFIDITRWEDLCDLFYLLLVGTGVGFRCTTLNAAMLKPIRTDFTLLHSAYNPIDKNLRLEETTVNIMDNGYAKIYVGDSKEGWVKALYYFLSFLTNERYRFIRNIKISYNSIRPKGERLKTFGGMASGHEPLKEMFAGIENVVKNRLDERLHPLEAGRVRPVHILDIGNLIGNNVVVGGVRRTAEMFMCDASDEESITAKQGLLERPHLHHRFMSNNSVVFEEKPTRETLHRIFTLIKENGEPGFVNMEAACKRRPGARGLNPCGEVILDSLGVCNLTTVNVCAFIKDGMLNIDSLLHAQALSARAGLRMTCVDLELPHWDKIHKRDRLIGCSLTGWQDAIDQLEYDELEETNLLLHLQHAAQRAAITYAHELRIPAPLLSTTVKPEGTLSQVAGGKSSGLHVSFAPYYLRRIRINASDPLVRVAELLRWPISPEVGYTFENAKTYVIDFPVASGAKKTQADLTIEEQFATYLRFQKHYVSHNASNTIYVKDDEWEKAEQLVWDNWNDLIGVTFLPATNTHYELAPLEEISKERYNELKNHMQPFHPEILKFMEEPPCEATLPVESDCEKGACPVR